MHNIHRESHFKIHSDTTLLCSVQPGFLNLMVKVPFWKIEENFQTD